MGILANHVWITASYVTHVILSSPAHFRVGPDGKVGNRPDRDQSRLERKAVGIGIELCGDNEQSSTSYISLARHQGQDVRVNQGIVELFSNLLDTQHCRLAQQVIAQESVGFRVISSRLHFPPGVESGFHAQGV